MEQGPSSQSLPPSPTPAATCGSPELPAQLPEEKGDGDEAQGGRGGEDAGPVILQVPPQAAGEGLWAGGGGALGCGAGLGAAPTLEPQFRSRPDLAENQGPWCTAHLAPVASGRRPGK